MSLPEDAAAFCETTCQAATLHGWKLACRRLPRSVVAFEWLSPEGENVLCQGVPAIGHESVKEALHLACQEFREIISE